jgi:hypothetical protein
MRGSQWAHRAILLVFSAILLGVSSGGAGPERGLRIVLNDREYFEAPGFAFLLFQNNYQEMFLGGLEMIQSGDRVLAAGDLMLKRKGEPDHATNPGPVTLYSTLSRKSDREHATVTVFATTRDPQAEDLNFVGETRWRRDSHVVWKPVSYRLTSRTDGSRILITLELDQPVDWSTVERAGFRIWLDPIVYSSRSFLGGRVSGLFPPNYSGVSTLLEGADKLRIAPEDPAHSFTIARRGGALQLVDDRKYSMDSWFYVAAPLEPGSRETRIEVEITPSIDPAWRQQPVIGVSQAGYHPKQRKEAVLQLDLQDQVREAVKLYRLEVESGMTLVKSGIPRVWGHRLGSRYATFDFTDIRQPGMYLLQFRGRTAGPFRIATDVYDRLWEPTLEYFLPEQMCHVAVRQGERTWHGACHLDDARQAPAWLIHIDGYRQQERETRFADNEHIPGLNWGGWHDAGDQDLPAGSIAQTVLALALAQEEFKPEIDRTTVRRAERLVLLDVPDGQPDMLQQVEFGVEGLLASYRVAGHIFPGIIETSWSQYAHAGDPVNITDNLIYDPALKPGEVSGDRSGRPDDRWVFTNRNTGLQYEVAQALAAASRVLREYKRNLSDECLAAARNIWADEQTHPPVYPPDAYAPRDSGYRREEILATAELLLTTGEARYRERLVALLPHVRALSAAEFGRGPGWTLVRLLPVLPEGEFRSTVLEHAKQWKQMVAEMEASNPYRVPSSWPETLPWKLESPSHDTDDNPDTDWGRQGMYHYYFLKHLPDMFNSDALLSALNCTMGVHPASNEPYVAGIGFAPNLITYNLNRDDRSYVPGAAGLGGALLIKPGYWEFKRSSFLWEEREPTIAGAGVFIFHVLAARKILGD